MSTPSPSVEPVKQLKRSSFPSAPAATDPSRQVGSLTQTPHSVLGVTAGASSHEIRRAYRARLIETHPDKRCGSRAAFDAVQAAYQRLSGLCLGGETNQSTVIVDTLGLTDPDIELCDSDVSLPCRCGDFFTVPLSHVAGSSALVACHGCSLSVVVFDDRDKSD